MQEIVIVFEEIATEIGRELAAEPLRIVAEVVQFLLLFGIAWVVAIGWGKRRGFVANMLAERAELIDHDVTVASHAPEDLQRAQSETSQRLEAATAQAEAIVLEARTDAQHIEEAARSEADAEAQRITDRARAALETEAEAMRTDVRDELVSIVAQASRTILNEKLTVSEQRKLIESAITGGVESAAKSHPGGNGHRARAKSSAAASGATS